MAAACGVTIIKRFSYRGANEEYSNTYWLTGAAPANATDWRTLFNDIANSEKAIWPSSVVTVRGYGYDDDTGHKTGDVGDVAPAVWSVDLTVSPNTPIAGTLSTTGLEQAPGDAAVWVRWKTSRLNTKGKPIFLRKYFHPAMRATGGDADDVPTAQTTALNAHGAYMYSGTITGSKTITAAGHTDTITATGSSAWITTHTLKRRGKRPGV